jgi:hypothetical protein
MAEKGSFYKKTLAVAAGLSTLAVLTNPVNAEVITCGKGENRAVAHMEIPDGQPEKVSRFPDDLTITSRRDGGVTIDSRLSDAPSTQVTLNALGKEGEIGFFVPGNSVIVNGFGKMHQITHLGRTPDNKGSVVDVSGVCTKYPSTK